MRREVERGSSFGSCLILEVFGVACCCVCKVCILYKKGQWGGKIFGYEKFVGSFEAMLACSCKYCS